MSKIYIAGEKHRDMNFMTAEVNYLKKLLHKGKIHCVSLELDAPTYQYTLDTYTTATTGMPFGHHTPLVNLAKREGLELLASDYRETLSHHIVKAIDTALDEIDLTNITEKEKDKALIEYLQPILLSKPLKRHKAYLEFFKQKNPKDIVDFFREASKEESERYAVFKITDYIHRHPENNVIHIPGLAHVSPLKKKFENVGHEVTIVHLLNHLS